MHANARLNLHGRILLVRRIRFQRRPVSHVARELGVSRRCAHTWIKRYDHEGWSGLRERSSRPNHQPRHTSEALEHRVLRARHDEQAGPIVLAAVTGVPARTTSRILARHRVPHLADCDPVTGTLIRATRRSGRRYEHPEPGDLVHIDVKKLGRIPDGGGWRLHGRASTPNHHARVGFDYVHALVDDHSRWAYAGSPARRERRHLRRLPASHRCRSEPGRHRTHRPSAQRQRPQLPRMPRLRFRLV